MTWEQVHLGALVMFVYSVASGWSIVITLAAVVAMSYAYGRAGKVLR